MLFALESHVKTAKIIAAFVSMHAQRKYFYILTYFTYLFDYGEKNEDKIFKYKQPKYYT